MRYSQIIDILKEKKPKTILELGTWNGERALEMLNECPDAEYYGFDLFEDATPITDLIEFNVKSHWRKDDVLKRLKAHKAKLYKGNTRETLKDFNETIDFAFIDGGHSVETIQSDWAHVKKIMNKDGIVIFDDYYTEMPGAYLELFGCNNVLKALNYKLLPLKDGVKGGGKVQMAIVKI